MYVCMYVKPQPQSRKTQVLALTQIIKREQKSSDTINLIL